MTEHVILGLSGVIVLGVGAQWLAWRLRLPSILLLLVIGVVAGPLTGLLDPDDLFGASLLPLVSISVALILYEGGLSLRLSDLPKVGGVVRNLLTLGVVTTWLTSAIAAYWVLGFDGRLAVLLGAILVVTGPTVVLPLLQHVRPVGSVASILKWEGIAIDPIGAVLAVLVFEVITAGDALHHPWTHAGVVLLKTLAVGGGLGLAAAGLLTFLLKRYWIPDDLQNAVSLMLVVMAYCGSHLIQEESGLLAVTVMGVALANQTLVPVKHIVEFKEDLRVLLISILFILLGARLKMADITQIGPSYGVFVLVLIFVARPLSVWVSTLSSALSWQQRAFVCWMAPRGIVAAAVSSVFALRLEETGHGDTSRLVSATFAVIVGTVSIYGLTASLVARKLGVADRNPQGILIVGAHAWARALAEALKGRGYRVLLADTNQNNIAAARMAGLETYRGSVLSEYFLNEVNLGGIGRLLAATPNNEVNVLAAQRMSHVFGTAQVYRLAPDHQPTQKRAQHTYEHGRLLFDNEATYSLLSDRMRTGAVVKVTKLSEAFDYQAFKGRYGPTAIPLLLIHDDNAITVIAADQAVEPAPGQSIVCLVDPGEAAGENQ